MLAWALKRVAAASAVALSTIGVLGLGSAKARFAFKVTLYTGVLGLTSIWGVFVSLIATVTGQRFNINYIVARSFYGLCSPLVGIRMHVEGGEHLTSLAKANEGKGQSAVLITNHQSFLDILLIGRVFPKRASIMSKKELQWIPLLGPYMMLSGAVMIDRRDRTSSVRALEKAGEVMKSRGMSLWVFPEGTRSSKPEPTLLPFKKGAFHLAVQAQVPIVPIVCENYWRLFDGKTRMNVGDLRIRVLPPISTEGLTPDDVGRLAEEAREAMLSTLIEISEPGPSRHLEAGKTSTTDPLQDEGLAEPGAPADGVLSANQSGKHTTGSLRQRISRESPSGADTDHSTEDEMDDDAVLLKLPKAGS